MIFFCFLFADRINVGALKLLQQKNTFGEFYRRSNALTVGAQGTIVYWNINDSN